MNKEFTKRIISSIILIPISLFIIIKGSFFFNFFILVCFLITAYEWHMMTKNKSFNIPGFIFLIISFYFIFLLRNNFTDDYFVFLMVTLICVSTDIGGYMFGKIFKGPKLTKISPNKTYSGMLGSFLFSLIFGYLFFYYQQKFLELNINVLLFIIIVSFISQIGDLMISFFKRKAKIKDTGSILPGHGGILDRIDGMLLALPIGLIFI